MPHSAPPIWWSSWGACGFSRNHCDFNPKAPKHLNVLQLGRHSSLGRWESESRGRALSPGQLAVVEPSSISHRDTAWDPPGEEAKLVGDRDSERGYGWGWRGQPITCSQVSPGGLQLSKKRTVDSEGRPHIPDTVGYCCTGFGAPKCFCVPVFSLQRVKDYSSRS